MANEIIDMLNNKSTQPELWLRGLLIVLFQY